MTESDAASETDSGAPGKKPVKRKRSWGRFMMLARRTHLYVGLFLLPWVFLYGITGAMFNHQGLLPDVEMRPVPASIVGQSGMVEFPTPDELAKQVAAAIDAKAKDVSVEVAEDSGAKFTSTVKFEFHDQGRRHVMHINPHDRQTWVAKFPEKNFKPEAMIRDVKNVRLKPNPQDLAKSSAQQILTGIDVSKSVKPKAFGWTKLNFLANVDGQKARVTYVLKDGHVDVTRYNGEPGMSTRAFFMKLHTTHLQSPSWTGLMVWSLFVDAMAIAMVSWGVTGLLMWWQIKRVRLIGGIVMAASIVVAVTMFFAMQHFYATNML